jgi:signal transduction histidine kinase
VAALVGVAQYRSVVAPLWNLKNAVNTIAAGQFNQRVPAEGATEFADLARQFNRMAAQLEASYRDLEQKVEAKSRELVRNERLASVGFLAAGVAHEINNPLGIMTAHAELALAAMERDASSADEECRRTLRIVCEEAFRCKKIVEKLLTLARSPQEPPAAFSLGQLAAETVQAVAAMPEYQRRQLTWEIAPTPDRILARCGEIRQVILNLLSNALEATEAGGDVRLTVSAGEGKVVLTVADSGRGMSPEIMEKIFEPFFTDRHGKAGTGLGLAITHAIVSRYGGQIEAHSDGAGKGSRLIVTFAEAAKA